MILLEKNHWYISAMKMYSFLWTSLSNEFSTCYHVHYITIQWKKKLFENHFYWRFCTPYFLHLSRRTLCSIWMTLITENHRFFCFYDQMEFNDTQINDIMSELNNKPHLNQIECCIACWGSTAHLSTFLWSLLLLVFFFLKHTQIYLHFIISFECFLRTLKHVKPFIHM